MIPVTKEILKTVEQLKYNKRGVFLIDICDDGIALLILGIHIKNNRFIVSINENTRIEDDNDEILVINIFDSKYDGPLYLDYLKELYYILTKGKKHLTFK